MASSYTPSTYNIGCRAKRRGEGRMRPSPRRTIALQRDGGAIGGAIVPNAPAWLRAWVQNNFGRALLLPSREENISILSAAV